MDEVVSTKRRNVAVEFDVPAEMRDGVTLRANVYRPEGEGPWPTLLTRLPYGKDDPEMTDWLDPVQAARRGFMVVIQDTRGRFASEGEWEPFRFEAEDGHDSVEWAARLPGSNGRVGMFGLSYFGNTQWTAAAERPRALAAIAPGMTWSDPMDGLFSRGGAVELGLALPWMLAMGFEHLARARLSERERRQRIEALIADFEALPRQGYWELPVADSDLLRRSDLPELGNLRVSQHPDSAGWCAVSDRLERVTVPSLHLGGWYDVVLQGTLDNYAAMAALGRPTRLLVGPWTHTNYSDPIGELCFGLRAARVGVPAHLEGDLNDLQLAWFRRHLIPGGEGGTDEEEAPVRIFVMGRNEWRDEDSWPLERARTQKWFLSGGGLGPEPEEGRVEVTEFLYDPADPVPSRGGSGEMWSHFPAGPVDQSPIEARPDVCVFTSEPLREDLEVIGPVRVILHAESSAPSTDWVARLCDVHPDGRSFNLCDGILRVTEGADRLGRHEIDLWSTCNVFLAGHRLRVHLTSSSFPRWDRNLNTGNQGKAHFETARQRIYHDSEHPSWIELPVVG